MYIYRDGHGGDIILMWDTITDDFIVWGYQSMYTVLQKN